MVPAQVITHPFAALASRETPADHGHSILVLAGIEVPALSMHFTPNEEIFGEEEPAEFVYKVISGAVRSFRILDDGRRQIGDFYLAGDMFGAEPGEAHRFSAEAVSACEIVLARRTAVERAAGQNPVLAHALRQLTFRDLTRAEDHLLMLGRKSATERVVSFLRDMVARTGSGNLVRLPMSRTDIADYLGLTIETVSRTLTQLERSHAIDLPSVRHVVLHRSALAA